MKQWFRQLEQYVKPLYLVIAFLILLLIGLWAESAKAETAVEVGPGFLSAEFSEGGGFILSERWGKYSVMLGYISEQWVTPRTEPRTFVQENVFFGAQRHVQSFGCLELGLGVAVFNNTSRALGSQGQLALSLSCDIGSKYRIAFRHFSCAGSCTPNMGQDLITFARRF